MPTMAEFFLTLPLIDLIAILWLAGVWSGYSLIADQFGRHRRELAQELDGYRQRWMERMLERDNRMTDVNIIIAHHRSGALFASTTILILAGVVALLGNIDRVLAMVDLLSFATLASRELTEIKVMTLFAIFAYAFFKFAWCLRQHNTALVVIGAAPLSAQLGEVADTDFAVRAAKVLTRANVNFNRGIRAYYFSVAALAWFIHPLIFMVATVLVMLVLYRRDYHSATLAALTVDVGPKA